jgi:protein-tyrosine phosphatase
VPPKHVPSKAPRDLTWDGCLNVRELGGLPTDDGGETRTGSIVRADSVHQLSDDGWQALVDHGIRTVIDLRGDHEREDDPPAELPVDVVHVPFMEASEAEWEEIAEELEAAAAVPDIETATREAYLIFLERFEDNVAAAVRAVARAQEGGVVVHCVGGKDRTGLLAAFLLHVAGVSDEQIAADYALSEERLRPRHEAWFEAADSEEELERLRRIAQTPAASMSGVFVELERRHGTVEGFLRDAGVTEEELGLVRRRLRA